MRQGLSYFHETIFEGLPRFLRRIDTALKNIGQPMLPLDHCLFKFGSWCVLPSRRPASAEAGAGGASWTSSGQQCNLQQSRTLSAACVVRQLTPCIEFSLQPSAGPGVFAYSCGSCLRFSVRAVDALSLAPRL